MITINLQFSCSIFVCFNRLIATYAIPHGRQGYGDTIEGCALNRIPINCHRVVIIQLSRNILWNIWIITRLTRRLCHGIYLTFFQLAANIMMEKTHSVHCRNGKSNLFIPHSRKPREGNLIAIIRNKFSNRW